MTHPDEPTIAAAPQKAHGDALEDVAQASAESATSQPVESAETDQDG